MKKIIKNRKTRIVAVVLAVCLLLSVSVAAASAIKKNIVANYMDIKLVVNGITVTPKDANGTVVEPFIADGTTYLPVRALAEALGEEVEWDGVNKIVYVGENPNKVLYLPTACPAYEGNAELCTSLNGKSFKMAGSEYTNGFDFYANNYYELFNLNAEYDYVTMTVGHVDGSSMSDGVVRFFVDGELALEVDVSAEGLPQQVTLPLNYALQLKIVVDSDAFWEPHIGLADMRIYK